MAVDAVDAVGSRDPFGSRKRAAAAVASALLAAALAVAAAGRGCGADEDSPAGVVLALIEAARAGDQVAAFELLGPRTRASLQSKSRRATELVGGDRRYRPNELLALGRTEARAEPPRVELVSRDGDTAVVEVQDGATTARLAVVRVDGHWRVELDPATNEP